MQARDMYGNIIQKGDIINYPVRKGSSTYMRTARVLDIQERQLEAMRQETVLKVAMAKAPRKWERAAGNWDTEIIKVTVSLPHRTTVIPRAYIQNDRRYSCLLSV